MIHTGYLPEKNAKERGKKEALFFEDNTYTFQNLDNKIGQIANGLKNNFGIDKGNVIALHMRNSPEFVLSMFAAWRLGATVTPINPALTAEEVSYQLQDSQAKVWIYDAQVQQKAPDVIERLSSNIPFQVVIGEKKEREVPWNEIFEREPIPFSRSYSMEKALEEIALIIYTSGTTGRPKGVMLSHQNLYHMTRSQVESMELTENDRALLILPLFHVNGIMVTLVSPFFVGASTVICKRFHPTEFLENISRYKPTYFSAVPTIYSMLLQLPQNAVQNVDFGCLRFGLCGAAPMPKDLFLQFEQRYPIKIIEGYGLSEGTVASTANPLKGKRKIGSIGLPLPGQEIKIVDETDQELPPGDIGEIIISGQNIMVGYLNRPKETKKTIQDGWLHSGDLGYKDEEGYIYIVDRKKDMIIRGGQNIYPAEIEGVLYRHPAVYEAAVIGVEDKKYGEEVKAFVSLKADYDVEEEELIQYCQEHLAFYKTPKFIEFIDDIPKNAVGKITKAPLRRYSREGLSTQ